MSRAEGSPSGNRSEGCEDRGLRGFAGRHPQLVAWAVLSVLMVAMVLWSAKDVQLLAHQRAAIVLATIGLAGLCVWIIGWE